MTHNPFFDGEEGKKLIELLKKVKQPWTYEFMYWLNRLIPMMGVESVFLRENNGTVEVLLDQRDDNDIDWAGNYHVPGSTCRDTDIVDGKPSDEIYQSILRRVWSKELGLTEDQMAKIKATKVDTILWRHKRGGCMSVVFFCTADGIDFSKGKFFPASDLPQPFLGGQEIVVNTALKYVLDRKYVFC